MGWLCQVTYNDAYPSVTLPQANSRPKPMTKGPENQHLAHGECNLANVKLELSPVERETGAWPVGL